MDNNFDVLSVVLVAMFFSLTSAAGCVDCNVKGQVHQGHSRFQYDEGCNRYRCICSCDGSWTCPVRHIINLCERSSQPSAGQRHPASSPDAPPNALSASLPVSSEADDKRCTTCAVNGEQHQGNSYFNYVEDCTAFRNCFCYCNGSWICPKEAATKVCSRNTSSVSSELDRSITRDVQSGKEKPFSRPTSSDSDGSVGLTDLSAAESSSDVPKVYPRCLNCTAGGKVIKGNNYFELVEGCRKLNYCTCFCNGTWTCPERFAENICDADTPEVTTKVQVTCKSCSVKGRTFPGNRYFHVTDGCVQYEHCVCYCDGSWTCPESKPISNCSREDVSDVLDTPRSTCKPCTVNGKIIEANENFHLTESCIEYRSCVCQCNGSWSCAKDDVRNVCARTAEGRDNSSLCVTCDAYGSIFPGNQYFQVTRGCLEYRNCVCHCNGSWFCPKDSTRNVCDGRKGMHSTFTGIGDPEVSETRCSSCFAYDKYFKGDSYFDVIDRCTSYRKCVCRCDGSWSCNERFAANICSKDTLKVAHSRSLPGNTTHTVKTSDTASNTQLVDNQCSFCDARNKVVIGNTLFELTDGCVEYKNCLCRCDGSWECPPQFANNICDEHNQTDNSGTNIIMVCANCLAKGKIIRGGSDFELADGCTLYQSCQCDCTGNWSCSTERVQNVCSKNASAEVGTCSMCQSSTGAVHPANSWFKLTDDCVEHTCQCFCNGSWSCPGDYNRWICEDRCLQCDVDGKIVANNTQFIHTTGCLEYTCNCQCNGSWSCPHDATRDTCTQAGRRECSQCSVSANQVYHADTDFILQQECLHYKCRCHCDGSYFCPGKEARNVCRGEAIGGCKSCVVSATEIHKAETDFALRKGCMFYNCRCNCDGGWQCPAENSRNVCLGEFPGGCRVCRVSGTEIYRPSSIFDFRKYCINYRCKCNCDGSWACPGKDARDICKGEVPGGCKSCVISDNEFYPGLSDFETVRSCVRYRCRCNCDGSFSCPGHTARRICQAGAQVAAPICKPCRVSATEAFAGNSTFTLDRVCSRFVCECKCDGSWECPPEKTVATCAEDRRGVASSDRCRSCRISDKVFPGITEFKFNRGCFQFDCSCNCSGRWSCDTKNLTNVCRDRAVTERPLVSSAASNLATIYVPAPVQITSESSVSGNTFIEPDIHTQEADSSLGRSLNGANKSSGTSMPSPDNISFTTCQLCHVDGRNIHVDEEFALSRGCIEYKKCRCHCNGRWQCAEVTNRCEENQTSAISEHDVFHRVETPFMKSRRTKVNSTSLASTDFDSVLNTNSRDGGYVSDQGVTEKEDEKRGKKVSEYVEKRYSNGSKKFKSPDICVGCEIRGVNYTERSKFVLRDGCRQRICECYCDGSWACVHSAVDICKVETKNPAKDKCKNCKVDSDVYIPERDFQINSECYQYNCHCFCNGSYDCPTDRRRNKCQPNIISELIQSAKVGKYTQPRDQAVLPAKENGDEMISSPVPGCKHCQENGKKMPTLATFTKHIGCYQVSCFCQCNGVPTCPVSSFVNMCKGSDSASQTPRIGCRVGQQTHFTRVFAHVEHCSRRACVCHNDGSWSCRRTANDRKVC